MKIQVLVTTMYESDFSKIREMNIQGRVLFANQADRYDYAEKIEGTVHAEMITTKTRGSSKNRNIAITNSSEDADVLVFADADLVFVDGYEKLIKREFETHPYADAIKFNLHDLSTTRKLSTKRIKKFERATLINMLPSGVCALAIKHEVLKKFNMHFCEYFGAGTKYYCGEDSIFFHELFRKKIAFYRSPLDIAGIDQTYSTWYEGVSEKYLTVNGMVCAARHSNLLLLFLYYIIKAWRFSRRKQCQFKFWQVFRFLCNGWREYHGKTSVIK